jgi:hypothetical protein
MGDTTGYLHMVQSCPVKAISEIKLIRLTKVLFLSTQPVNQEIRAVSPLAYAGPDPIRKRIRTVPLGSTCRMAFYVSRGCVNDFGELCAGMQMNKMMGQSGMKRWVH